VIITEDDVVLADADARLLAEAEGLRHQMHLLQTVTLTLEPVTVNLMLAQIQIDGHWRL
jgi:hypothetical protein